MYLLYGDIIVAAGLRRRGSITEAVEGAVGTTGSLILRALHLKSSKNGR